MKKYLLFIYFASFSFTTSLFAIENEFFSLTLKIYSVITSKEIKNELANPKIKKNILKYLECIGLYPALFSKICDDTLTFNSIKKLIEHNIAWTFLREFEIEDKKINLIRAQKNDPTDEKSIKELEYSYEKDLFHLINDCSEEEFQEILSKGIIEAVELLKNSISI